MTIGTTSTRNVSSEKKVPATVAIALPVYNGEDYLAEALDSFRRQTFPYFEMVICDNASSDRTPEIAQEFCRDDPRFIYARQDVFVNAKDNFVRAHRLTKGIGNYFLWACDDNIWHPEFLEKIVARMEANPRASACGFFLHHFGGSGAHHKINAPMPYLYRKYRLLQFLLQRQTCVSLYALMRRTAIDAIRLELGEIKDYPDRYYLAQLRCLGHFEVVEDDLLGFRAGGISSTGNDPWVRTVIDLNFGEAEIQALFSLPHLRALDKSVLALKYAYLALRHNIPDVAKRGWLAPAYLAAAFVNRIRPSRWRVTERGLQRLNQ